MKPAYIYALIDPNTEDVRYVGKTVNPSTRLYDHCNKGANGNNPHKMHWILGLRAQKKRPKMVILEECTGDEWEAAEIRWIAHYRSIGAPLTNILAGGRSTRDFQPRATYVRTPKPPKPRPFSQLHDIWLTKSLHNRLMAYIGKYDTKSERNAAIRKVETQALEQFFQRAKKKGKK